MSEGDLHPVELIAHSVLSGPLDSLNDNFDSLHKSQVVLLTRLRVIEDKLKSFKQVSDDLEGYDLTAAIARIKAVKKRLQEVDKKLDRVGKRVDELETK